MSIRTTTKIAAALVSLALLAGCAAGPSDAGLTLVETKSPVQLLRNDATNRVDQALVASVRKETDQSFPCFNEEENPGGLIRQWKSSAEIVLVADTDRQATASALVDSFVDQGWEAAEVSDDSSFGLTTLSSKASVATIEVSSADMSAVAIVRITATGPCVKTGGPDSDEVKNLQ